MSSLERTHIRRGVVGNKGLHTEACCLGLAPFFHSFFSFNHTPSILLLAILLVIVNNLIMASMLNALQSASVNESSATESSEVTIAALSAPINGKFGAFRQVSFNGNTYNVDDSKCHNTSFFRPNCKASLTLQQYKNEEGVLKVIVSNLSFILPDGVAVLR